MTYIITPENLHKQRNEEHVVIIDVRSNLQHPELGESVYKKGHLPGAYYLHLEKDLSGEVKKHGGNHPLPNITELAEKLGSFGINEHSKVVVYDATNDMYAARAWWLLRHVGIDQTFVLNGGFSSWTDAGYEVTTEIPAKKNSIFKPQVNADDTVTMEEVKNRDKHKTVLIDSRAYERYIGKTEPLYKKAGHIPGATNYFWQEVLDESGNWKDARRLESHFESLKDADEIIVSCGSGLSACPNILALHIAGFHNVKLYPGSFSDWISYDENEVETKEE